MLQPRELKLDLPMEIAHGVVSRTQVVWQILNASAEGDLITVERMAQQHPELLYAQYLYCPPIHFAVREGRASLVKFLLDEGAYDPSYRTYPFLDSLESFADDRGFDEIKVMLQEYSANPGRHKFKGDNGNIDFQRNPSQLRFENAVERNDLEAVNAMLETNPEYALDDTYFWGEGILMMPAKQNHTEMLDLLLRHGATVPVLLKWPQAYYFENEEAVSFLLKNGMSANIMNWHKTTILHHIAQSEDLAKAFLLLAYGADLNALDQEYQSTPLGVAARFGKIEMVKYLISKGADVNRSGASWSTPLAWAKKKGRTEIEILLKTAGAR